MDDNHLKAWAIWLVVIMAVVAFWVGLDRRDDKIQSLCEKFDPYSVEPECSG